MKKILLLFAFTANLSCNNRSQTIIDREPVVKAGNLTEIYKAPPVGWTTDLPRNWGEMTNADADKMTSTGLDDIEKSTGVTINAESLKQLVNLNQQLLTRVINNLHFGMTLTYNNKEDENELEEILKKSKFSIC
jgi:hypothetical protein